jgi:hypothetical protein
MSAESKQAKRKKSAEAITRPGKGPWYDWLDSSEGQQATKQEDCLLRGNYLENRLWRAFIAGMKAGFEQGGWEGDFAQSASPATETQLRKEQMTVAELIAALQEYQKQYPRYGAFVMVPGGFVTGVSWMGETDGAFLEHEPSYGPTGMEPKS